MMWISEAKQNFAGSSFIVRIDADVDLELSGGKLVVDEDFRLKSSLATINLLRERGADKIILLGHIGRPGGKFVNKLSMGPVADWYNEKFGKCRLISLDRADKLPSKGLFVLENLRFDHGEEKNSLSFSKKLSSLADFYVNDAFGVSHRKHSSLFGVCHLLPSFLGVKFEGEVKTLMWIKNNAPRPLVFVLGGSKSDKKGYVDFLSSWADKTLIGGKVPQMFCCRPHDKVVLASLNKTGKDIDEKSIDNFKKIIGQAKSIIWAGPMGVYEEEENRRGSWEIAKFIVSRPVFKAAGGGDTHRIISMVGIWKKFDFVSVGGGAMLTFLKKETLPVLDLFDKRGC